jgi:NAD(P)-dependent dehydrogenase (short-subunit alcohol dehydrogenase family)
MSSNDRGALAGRRAIVTGAGRGIGEAIARQFAEAGAQVVLAARSAEDLERVAAEIRAAGGTAHCVPTDMGDVGQVTALVARSAGLMGGIDIVVSNAAAVSSTPILDISLEEWNRVQQVNVIGTLTLFKAAFPHLTARPGGNAIVISSIQGLAGTPVTGAYGASKAALNHLTKTLAVEWGPAGVRVNAILPGPVLTPLMRESSEKNPRIGERFENAAPLAGWTLSEDIAGPAVFLASGAARKINGHLLVVDGGLVAYNQDCFALRN